MKKTGRVLALAAWALLYSSLALAEGSADFDLGETLWNGSTGNRANDQAVDGATVIRVDIANSGAEKVCWVGSGTMALQRPNGTTIATVASNNCVSAIGGLTGAYFADIGDQVVGSAWDIRVCAGSVSDGACLSTPSNEQLGRVWSSAWSFQQNTSFTDDYSVNGSVYAVVPGGAVGRDAVIEMQMRGVSGAYYVLRANSTGPVITASGARVGRSVPMGGQYGVNAEYPLYLSPPAGALYNWTRPVISNVVLTPACGTGVVLGRAAGQVSFTSNVSGQYVVVCDVNKDSTYDFAGTADFSSFGAAAVGTNTISWDGRNNAGASAAEGSYSCIVRLNVGEFHYVAEDIETAYPGIRMYRVESNKTARTPVRMFWDDQSAVLASGSLIMLNGQAAPSSPLATGLDPTASTNPTLPFYFTGGNRAQPNGNARAWGNFTGTGTGTGIGNNNYLDQFAAADTALSSSISVSVISSGGDADTDGLSNTRECDLGSQPQDNDTDNDGVNDGYEATQSGASTNTDSDTLIDILDPDDDGDGVLTSVERGPVENGDGNPADAANSDGLGARDYLDTDSDDDGVLDGVDIARTNPLACRDVDNDRCDDCSRTGANSSGGNTNNDGADSNIDGQCDPRLDQDGDGLNDTSDLDDDGDGILDTQENTAGLDPDGDADSDGISNLLDADNRGDGMPNACAHTRDPRVCDAPSTLFDQDGDGNPNHLDLDSDADGLSDARESGHAAPDVDGRLSGATGANGVADAVEDAIDSGRVARPIDTDGDGLPNFLDRDSEGSTGDLDGDGSPDATDLDDDGDGILDTQEGAPDADLDGDGSPNQRDLDADGDGIYDADESGHDAADKNADGQVDGPVGANGVADAVESAPDSGEVPAPLDTDDDGAPDFLDVDSDGDGVEDAAEAGDERLSTPARDSDDDGTPDYRDLDDDGDGLLTRDERSPAGEDIDSDEDGKPDYLDADDDDDGIATSDERTPDGDDLDSDGDGTPNHLDPDDDGDGVPTDRERGDDGRDLDSDRDGEPDHLDDDDDGDGIATADEAEDADDDGIPDRLEPQAHGTLAGGALCSLRAEHTSAANPSALSLLALLGLWIARRRRAQKRGARARRVSVLGVLGGLFLIAGSLRPAHAQVALDQLKPAPLARDGFALARPDVLTRGAWSSLVLLDYANDPLVYEPEPGSSAQQERVVSQHLVGHVSAAVGVARRVTLFGSLPVHLLMKGDSPLTVDAPEPDGAGLGDLALGGRIQLTGLEPDSLFGSALELLARVPTAELADKDQHYSGDAIGSYEPALIGELRVGRFDVRLRAGARLREKKNIGNLTLGSEWIGGLGMRVRVLSTFYLHGEAYGSTFMSNAFKRTATPIEALFGIKHQGEAWNVGVAAGPGLWQGYGSPDVRVVSMLGYAPLAKKVIDSDGDGFFDTADRCPKEPEDVDGFEDGDGCPDLDNDKDGLPDGVDSCIDEPEDTDDFEDTDGCPDRDNDKDGVRDEDDGCPFDPEDLDQFEDSDGCDEPDNDKDGILDARDSCPDKPEDRDGFEDQDGCPEEGGGKVKLACGKIELDDSVYFDSSKDTIQQRSFLLLDHLSHMLSEAKHILKVHVRGHTDDTGDAKKNLDLSQRRAASVVRYLIVHGVDAARLSSEGYGESEPIADNKTPAGRARNRRVELQVVEQSGECR